MYTTFCIFSAAALALCKLAAGQVAGGGAATIGTMEGTFTVPFDAWDGTSPPECTSVMEGCTGEFVTLKESTAGTITVLDDCTYKISQYSFSGEGPAVEWCVFSLGLNDRAPPRGSTLQLLGIKSIFVWITHTFKTKPFTSGDMRIIRQPHAPSWKLQLVL